MAFAICFISPLLAAFVHNICCFYVLIFVLLRGELSVMQGAFMVRATAAIMLHAIEVLCSWRISAEIL
jgi:hypothetical protein